MKPKGLGNFIKFGLSNMCSFLPDGSTSAYLDYMDLAVRCSRKAVKLNHSLTHYQQILKEIGKQCIPKQRAK